MNRVPLHYDTQNDKENGGLHLQINEKSYKLSKKKQLKAVVIHEEVWLRFKH